MQPKRCSCHSDHMYDMLDVCPTCGHWSLDRVKDWEGCERRRCGYERVLPKEEQDA